MTRFAKKVLCMHSFKTYFLSPFVSYINGPTACVFNTAEGWTVCFHPGVFLKPVWHPRVLGWSSIGPIFPWEAHSWLWITTQLAYEFVHRLSCFVWHVEVQMAPIGVIHAGQQIFSVAEWWGWGDNNQRLLSHHLCWVVHGHTSIIYMIHWAGFSDLENPEELVA